VRGIATVVKDAVERWVEAIVGTGKHPEQFLPAKVHLAGRIGVDAKPNKKN